jgi:enoyl-[acyl-carrier protein] reductase I
VAINVSNKKGLIVGVANQHSIAWGCAEQLHLGGASLALTYQNEKAKPYVELLSTSIAAAMLLPLDVTDSNAMDAVFAAITERWGKLDFLIHSIAYAPQQDLHGRVVDASLDGFLMAMDISCHSFLRLVQRAEPLMHEGGSVLTMSYYGADKVVSDYGIMGPVKAALESCVEYAAAELGSKHIRINAISAGAMPTRAASGLKSFDRLLEQSASQAPLGHISTTQDVGNLAAFLVSDYAKNITGGTHYVDSGYHVIAA